MISLVIEERLDSGSVVWLLCIFYLADHQSHTANSLCAFCVSKDIISQDGVCLVQYTAVQHISY